jgi:hypothetical protein
MPTFEPGRRGSPNVLAIPGRRWGAPKPTYANQIIVNGKPFRTRMGTLNLVLSGVSKDSAGSVLANCRVLIFRTEDNSFIGETTSDGSGAWSVSMMKGGPLFVVAYKAGAPDVAGTSRNDLVPLVVP